jgi:glucose/arabinose dehydrogenase
LPQRTEIGIDCRKTLDMRISNAIAFTVGATSLALLSGCTTEVSPSAGSISSSTNTTIQPDTTSSTVKPAPSDPQIESSNDPTPTVAITPATTPTKSTLLPAPPDPPPSEDQLRGVSLRFESVFDVFSPTGIAWRDEDSAMYVTTQDGLVLRVDGDETSTVIDLSSQTAVLEPGSERGLLGIAFDSAAGRMFLNMTDKDHDTVVISYELANGVAIPDSRREVLAFDQPGLGHNGGRLLFDRDGNLYIGSGDGGGSNGRDAQDNSKLLGAILRIRPDPDGDGYEIPVDNPFADGELDRPEIWARGLRNPWGFSIDDGTGDLWIGDVGNEMYEEIDVIRSGEAGLNFGWYFFEGDTQRRSEIPDDLIPPIHTYPRSEGVAVMGGYVYRGDAIPSLRGAYVFGDLTSPIWAIGESGVTRLDAERVNTLVGWGEDPSGELYVLSLYDGVFRVVPA